MTKRVTWGLHQARTNRHKSLTVILPSQQERLKNMIKYPSPGSWADALNRVLRLGHGAMAAQQTLDLFILVRARMPQLVAVDDIEYD